LIAALFFIAIAIMGPEAALAVHPVDLDQGDEGHMVVAGLIR